MNRPAANPPQGVPAAKAKAWPKTPSQEFEALRYGQMRAASFSPSRFAMFVLGRPCVVPCTVHSLACVVSVSESFRSTLNGFLGHRCAFRLLRVRSDECISDFTNLMLCAFLLI